MSDSIILGMDRRFLCTLVCCAFVLSLFYLPVPVGAGKFEKPIKIILEKTGLDKVFGKIGAGILKKGNIIVGTITGKFEKIHKNVERGVLWLKHHKGEISGGLISCGNSIRCINVCDDGH